MYRATTPEFNLIIPYNVQEVEKFVITLQQKGKTIIEYTNESREVTFEDRLIYFQLSQMIKFLFRLNHVLLIYQK